MKRSYKVDHKIYEKFINQTQQIFNVEEWLGLMVSRLSGGIITVLEKRALQSSILKYVQMKGCDVEDLFQND